MAEQQPRVAVLGAGNWGTTLAHLIGGNGHPLRLWSRNKELVAQINDEGINRRYLDGFSLSENILATTSLKEAVEGVEAIVMVIPSSGFRAVSEQLAPIVAPHQVVIHATKGLEYGSYKRMSEIVLEETCLRQYGVLSGPNIAREVMEGKPAGTVIASPFPRVIAKAQELFTSPIFRVYLNDDVIGVELGGALKNIIAIAAGIASELELGENTRSLLITRGLQEILRIGTVFGANSATFSGLAGIGDLMVTCASVHSRNFRLGRGLARGGGLQEVVAELGMVAEGVHASRVAHAFVREHGIYAPVMEAVYKLVHEDAQPLAAIRELMAMDARPDVDFGRG